MVDSGIAIVVATITTSKLLAHLYKKFHFHKPSCMHMHTVIYMKKSFTAIWKLDDNSHTFVALAFYKIASFIVCAVAIFSSWQHVIIKYFILLQKVIYIFFSLLLQQFCWFFIHFLFISRGKLQLYHFFFWMSVRLQCVSIVIVFIICLLFGSANLTSANFFFFCLYKKKTTPTFRKGKNEKNFIEKISLAIYATLSSH